MDNSPQEILKDLPRLETARLLLRKLTLEDAQPMFEYAVDRELAGLGLWPPFDTLEDSIADLQEAQAGYARGDLISWAVQPKTENQMIGRIGLNSYSLRNFRAEIGYAFNRRYWGQGYATEAVRAVLEFGFRQLGLHRIEGMCLPENSGSIRVLEKNGLRYEGCRRQATFVRGKFDDLNLYAILRPEWETLTREEQG